MSDREHREVLEDKRTDDEPSLGLKGSQTMSDREHKEVVEEKRTDEPLSELKGKTATACPFFFKKVQLTEEQMSELQSGGKIACHITVIKEDELTDEEREVQREDPMNDGTLLVFVVPASLVLGIAIALAVAMIYIWNRDPRT